MKTKLINDGPPKTYVLVLEKGDEAVSSIEDFARKNGIGAAQLTGIGASAMRCSVSSIGRRRTTGIFLSLSRSRLSPSLATSPLGPMASRRCTLTLSSVAPTASRWAAIY